MKRRRHVTRRMEHEACAEASAGVDTHHRPISSAVHANEPLTVARAWLFLGFGVGFEWRRLRAHLATQEYRGDCEPTLLHAPEATAIGTRRAGSCRRP